MRQTRVFIVDDDADFAESLALALEGPNYGVDIAKSGEEAISKFREQDFDITFMDVKLPDKNGVDCFLEIRTFKPNAKVVMMSGYSVEQLLKRAEGGGAWGILHKPLDFDEVIGLIEKVRRGGVLIADDDPTFVESLKLYLELREVNVFTASNGQEALECVRKQAIDVLVLDLRMPIMGGLAAYLELHEAGYRIPTIIVTAYEESDSDDVERLRALSVSGILRKPFKFEKLVKMIEEISPHDGD